MVQLREDPAYFQQRVRDAYEHQSFQIENPTQTTPADPKSITQVTPGSASQAGRSGSAQRKPPSKLPTPVGKGSGKQPKPPSSLPTPVGKGSGKQPKPPSSLPTPVGKGSRKQPSSLARPPVTRSSTRAGPSSRATPANQKKETEDDGESDDEEVVQEKQRWAKALRDAVIGPSERYFEWRWGIWVAEDLLMLEYFKKWMDTWDEDERRVLEDHHKECFCLLYDRVWKLLKSTISDLLLAVKSGKGYRQYYTRQDLPNGRTSIAQRTPLRLATTNLDMTKAKVVTIMKYLEDEDAVEYVGYQVLLDEFEKFSSGSPLGPLVEELLVMAKTLAAMHRELETAAQQQGWFGYSKMITDEYLKHEFYDNFARSMKEDYEELKRLKRKSRNKSIHAGTSPWLNDLHRLGMGVLEETYSRGGELLTPEQVRSNKKTEALLKEFWAEFDRVFERDIPKSWTDQWSLAQPIETGIRTTPVPSDDEESGEEGEGAQDTPSKRKKTEPAEESSPSKRAKTEPVEETEPIEDGKGKGKGKELASSPGSSPPSKRGREEPGAEAAEESSASKRARTQPVEGEGKGKGKETAPNPETPSTGSTSKDSPAVRRWKAKLLESPPGVPPMQLLSGPRTPPNLFQRQGVSPPNKRKEVFQAMLEREPKKKTRGKADPERAAAERAAAAAAATSAAPAPKLPLIPVTKAVMDQLEVALTTGSTEGVTQMRASEWKTLIGNIGYEVKRNNNGGITATPRPKFKAKYDGGHRNIHAWTQHLAHGKNPVIPMCGSGYSIRNYMQGKDGFGSQGLTLEDYEVSAKGEPDTERGDNGGGGSEGRADEDDDWSDNVSSDDDDKDEDYNDDDYSDDDKYVPMA
ncbi:hypothetical protein PGQ11_010913 [Apiospora arundinis]|uniref:Uncharacterized protein n=1 Tax=Apiospora arundinis TaxID=335852 RepID=A0ABR2HYN2_9PEZI